MAQAILIIESDHPTRELYQRELSQYYEVLACADDQDALALLHTKEICAVVLEPALSDERGWALLAAIKNDPDTMSIPVILCSTLDERKRGMEMGAVAYLVKPILPAALRKTLAQVIQCNDAMRE